MKEARFYKKLKNKQVKCFLCARRCLIPENQLGFCRVRKNINGTLFSLVYGKAAALDFDPIEKKPFFHFAPGSTTLSFSTLGCTFRCKFCCNWAIAIEWSEITGEDLPPKKIVEIAKKQGTQGIAYTYVEPTIFAEYAIDTAKLNKGYNVFVTDGYATPESAKEISKHIDAAVVDFKASAKPESYKKLSQIPDVQPIFDCIETYKKNKVFLEISNLIIPSHGDKPNEIRKLCKWIHDNVGPNTPLHLIRFFPVYKMMNTKQTPIGILEKAYDIAKEEGLNYVYLGNVPGHKYESTYCPKCNELVIQRIGVRITKFLLSKDLKCKCGEKIHLAGLNHIPENLWKH
jgi:pyruvate formate lyase activating enzyme